MRLIDADALIEEHCKGCSKDIQDGCKTDPVCATLMWFEETPTVDAVHVVRCKDCKHWGGVVFGNVCRRWSAPLAGMRNDTKPDDFCSYGERKGG